MPHRVLIVVNDAAFFLSHRLPLALGARAAGYDVHLATPLDEASPRIEALGLPFHAVPLRRRGTSPRGELTTVRALVDLYRSLRPDLVHHVTAKPILYGGLAARIARVPAVVHAVSGLGYVFIASDVRARALQRGVRLAYRVATGHPNCAVIFQNEDDRAAFGDAIRTPTVAMIRGSGVDLEAFPASALPPPADGPPLVVCPSRMLRDKGVFEFVGAARALKREGSPARFALVGGVDEGNPAAISAATLADWVAEGVVEWWGQRSDMPEVLRQSTIVCLPSYREGMPKSLLEASVVGRPIVTTDVPGCRDVLRDATHGVLVPVRDEVALASAFRSLLGDRSRLEKMATAALATRERFSSVAVVRETLALYERLLARA